MAHAPLIQHLDDPHRCASCHEENAPGLAAVKIDDRFAEAHSQTKRCLLCHARQLPQMARGTPHDLTMDQLATMTAIVKDRARIEQESSKPLRTRMGWLVNAVKPQPINWHQHQLACSDCHREHQGSEHELRAMANQRCQACHQNQFPSFASGHPEFQNYPTPSTGQIAFDHGRHRDLHFAKTSTEFDCRVCHVNLSERGRVGEVFRSVSFETACVKCHAAPIKSGLADGIVVFQLPSIDLRGLAHRGVAIAPWPEEAGQLMDGIVPLMMRILMIRDPAMAEFASMAPNHKLSELNLEDAAHRQAVLRLVDSSKRLLDQLARNGQSELRQRLQSLVDPQNEALVEKLMRGLPPDLFRQAYQQWFPLNSPTNALREGVPVSTSQPPTVPLTSTTVSQSVSAAEVRLVEPDDSLLDPPTPVAEQSDSLLGESVSSSDGLLSEDASLGPQPTSDIREEKADWKELKGAKHLEAGGWMIDRQRMAIVYIPVGHADPWLTAMLTLGNQFKRKAAEPSDRDASELAKLAGAMLDQEHIGRCTECHLSVANDLAGSSRLVSDEVKGASSDKLLDHLWRADRFDARVRQLTRFDHSPHLLQSSLKDCSACHRMTPHEEIDFRVGHRDFESMKVQDCANCHRPQAAGDDCIQCHHYHTNEIELSVKGLSDLSKVAAPLRSTEQP